MSSSAFTALALRIVGFVLILVTLFNIILGFFPPNFQDVQWQLAVTGQIIDQSLLPLVGVVLLTASFWVDHVSQRSGGSLAPARMITYGFASLLGLILVLIIPLQINNARILQDKAITTINQKFNPDQPEFKKTVDEQMERQRQGIQILMENPQQLQAAIKGGQVTEEQVKLIGQFRADPKNLDAFLVSERKNIEKQLREQVEGRKQAEKDKLGEGWKAIVRASVSCLAIAIAYITMGWNGFRQFQDK